MGTILHIKRLLFVLAVIANLNFLHDIGVDAGPISRPGEGPNDPEPPKKPGTHDGANQPDDGATIDDNLEYHRYLKEVIDVIEQDPALKAKFQNVSEEDIRSGKIADMIDLHDGVRTKLGEIKRREVDRLRDAMSKLIEQEQYDQIKIPEHLDHANTEHFSKEDLRKLIKQTTKDLEELDKKRKDDFKSYEMKKKHEYDETLKHAANEAEKLRIKNEHEEMEKKHKQHEKVKHPGSKKQLEEAWEKEDKLDKNSFNMRTMFALHDYNQDGFLEPDELDSLFNAELDKLYDKDAPEDDMREREEELQRMREHVQKEMDKNKDGLVSLEEWLAEESDPNFNKDDEPWETIDDESPEFTDEEFAAFEREWAQKHPDEAAAAGVNLPNPGSHPNPSGNNPPHPAQGQNIPNPNAPNVNSNLGNQNPGNPLPNQNNPAAANPQGQNVPNPGAHF